MSKDEFQEHVTPLVGHGRETELMLRSLQYKVAEMDNIQSHIMRALEV